MRIVVLTHNKDRHFYFCNRIITETAGVVGVIGGAKTMRKTKAEILKKRFTRKEFPFYVRNRVLNAIFKPYGRKLFQEKRLAEQRAFGGESDLFEAKHSNLLIARVDQPYKSVNEDYYVNRIRELRPDVIAVMGTCLLNRKIIEAAPYVLNLHTGLSPYYRGGYTNLWPIVQNEYGYFGVTVHKMSTGIDAGDIVYSQRPFLEPGDNFGIINTRCIRLGTELMIRAIQDIAANRFVAVKQWERGKLFNNRDMNNYIAYQYFKEKDRFFETYRRLERENRLAQVKLINLK